MMKIVLMGVSGCGKSAVGRALVRKLGWPLIEGDDFHSPDNVEKMRQGTPLDSADRASWLASITEQMRDPPHVIVTCSALTPDYRDTLRQAGGDVRFVFLRVHRQMLAGRLAQRRSHFFNSKLLNSQLATLVPPQQQETDAVTLDAAAASVDALADQIISRFQANRSL